MYPHLSPTEYARLMDAAEHKAHTLRQQAIAGFWLQAGVVARNALRAARHIAGSLPQQGRSGKQQGA